MIESWQVFLGIAVVFGGGCAFMTGQALAETWRPWWHCLPYALALAAAARFLSFALFDETLLAVEPYLITAIQLKVISLAAYRLTQAGKMVAQYPWLYEREGAFGWREKGR